MKFVVLVTIIVLALFAIIYWSIIQLLSSNTYESEGWLSPNQAENVCIHYCVELQKNTITLYTKQGWNLANTTYCAFNTKVQGYPTGYTCSENSPCTVNFGDGTLCQVSCGTNKVAHCN